jgi:hypothetical protein
MSTSLKNVKIEASRPSETSVSNHKITRRNNPNDHYLNSHRRENPYPTSPRLFHLPTLKWNPETNSSSNQMMQECILLNKSSPAAPESQPNFMHTLPCYSTRDYDYCVFYWSPLSSTWSLKIRMSKFPLTSVCVCVCVCVCGFSSLPVQTVILQTVLLALSSHVWQCFSFFILFFV